MNDLTLSVVSHGHGPMLSDLLQDLDTCESLRGTRVIVTLNLQEPLDTSRYRNIDITVTRNPKPRGFGANHNAAFEHCDTPWFVVLNPDLRIRCDIFPSLVHAAQSDPRLAAMSPAVVNAEGVVEDHVRSHLTLASLLRKGRRVPKPADLRSPAVRPGLFYWLAGMFILFRADLYRHVGGFDERYFLYCEDYDICARLYLAGHALAVQPQLRVFHDAQRDSHRSLKHLRHHLSSLLRVWTTSAFWRIANMPRANHSTAKTTP